MSDTTVNCPWTQMHLDPNEVQKRKLEAKHHPGQLGSMVKTKLEKAGALQRAVGGVGARCSVQR